ncbi:MAG: MucR family transcriptional regulator [Pseudomonadota bacterium]
MNVPVENNEMVGADKLHLLELTSELVSAYVSNNPVSTIELPNLISEVHATLDRISDSNGKKSAAAGKPAVPVKKSVHDEYIICLEDGKKFKSLKRHLKSHFDLSPEEYREKWGLPVDYPMVAPAYAKARSQLAREMGLGRKPGTKIKKR